MRGADFLFIRYIPLFFFLVIWPGVLSAQIIGPSEQVTLSQLQSRTQLVENATELPDSIKALILEKYRQIATDLELVVAHNQRREALREAFQRTPLEIEAIRSAIEQKKEVDPVRNLQLGENISSEELERLLEQELTDQNAAESRLKKLEASLEKELQRPGLARDRIINAKMLLEETNRRRGISTDANVDPLLQEAEQWATQAKASAFQAEINMLDQELLGNRSQVRLNRYQQEEVQQEITRIQSRLEFIRTALRDRRREEMDAAIAQAENVLNADTFAAALERLAEANLELVEVRHYQIEMLDSLDRSYNRLRPISLQLTNAFASAKRKLGLEASDAPLGRIIREEREHFPRKKALVREREEMDHYIAEVSLRLIEQEEERQAMRNPATYLENALREAGTDSLDSRSKAILTALITTRLELLDRTISNDANLERGLYTLSEILDDLIEKTEAYDVYLDERLLWVRSSRPFHKDNFSNMYSSFRFFVSPENWIRCGRQMIQGFRENPRLLLLLLLAGVLIWRRRKLLNAISATGPYRRRPQEDHISYTLSAIGYTLLIALPLPLVPVFP